MSCALGIKTFNRNQRKVTGIFQLKQNVKAEAKAKQKENGYALHGPTREQQDILSPSRLEV